jgi:hypothetical protein
MIQARFVHSRPLVTSALCIGTDLAQGARPLRYSIKDADDVARFLSGPVSLGTTTRVLRNPTRKQVRTELHRQTTLGADVFVLYNSGHGTERGIVLADKVLSYEELRTWIVQIGARHSVVILDVCHAGAYLRKSLGDIVGGIQAPDLLARLARATPGNRVMCSVGAGRLAGEGNGIDNGHFTAALLEAAGRIDTHDGLIDDLTWFEGTAEIVSARWNQDPIGYDLTGDLPLARAQRFPQGTATLMDVQLADDTLIASMLVFARQRIPTYLSAELVNQAGEVIDVLNRGFVPNDGVELIGQALVVSPNIVYGDELSMCTLLLDGHAPLAWRLTVRDARGRQLGAFQRSFSWVPDRRLAIAR